MTTTMRNRWSSLPVILVICMTLLVPVANVWMSIEQVGDIRPLLFAAAGGGSGGDSSSMLEERQRLLENALIKANNIQTQMEAEIARSRREISKLQQEVEQMKKGMESHDTSATAGKEVKTSKWPKDSTGETKDSLRSKVENMMTPQLRNIAEPHVQTNDSPESLAVNMTTTGTMTKTTPSTETSSQGTEMNNVDSSTALGPVQAWSEGTTKLLFVADDCPIARYTRILPIFHTFPLTIAPLIQCYTP
jgi:hypothetical protein